MKNLLTLVVVLFVAGLAAIACGAGETSDTQIQEAANEQQEPQQEQSESKETMSDEEFRQLVDFWGVALEEEFEPDLISQIEYEIVEEGSLEEVVGELPAGIKSRNFKVLSSLYAGDDRVGATGVAFRVHKDHPEFDYISVGVIDEPGGGVLGVAPSYRNAEVYEQITGQSAFDSSTAPQITINEEGEAVTINER